MSVSFIEPDPVIAAELADLVAGIESKFAKVRRQAELTDVVGFGLPIAPVEDKAVEAQVNPIIGSIDWQFDGRAKHGATDEATKANIYEECRRLVKLAATETIPIGHLLFWRNVPEFRFELDFYTREILVGLFARGYVLGENLG